MHAVALRVVLHQVPAGETAFLAMFLGADLIHVPILVAFLGGRIAGREQCLDGFQVISHGHPNVLNIGRLIPSVTPSLTRGAALYI